MVRAMQDALACFVTSMCCVASGLEKIHNNLKMFLQAGDSLKYDKSQRELAGFLSKLCADETLECIDGRYQLRRDNR